MLQNFFGVSGSAKPKHEWRYSYSMPGGTMAHREPRPSASGCVIEHPHFLKTALQLACGYLRTQESISIWQSPTSEVCLLIIYPFLGNRFPVRIQLSRVWTADSESSTFSALEVPIQTNVNQRNYPNNVGGKHTNNRFKDVE